MSQQMRQPVRQEWQWFLDSVTRELEGEPVTIEVVSAELGSRGGKARAARMTPERRVEIAKKAAASRWKRS